MNENEAFIIIDNIKAKFEKNKRFRKKYLNGCIDENQDEFYQRYKDSSYEDQITFLFDTLDLENGVPKWLHTFLDTAYLYALKKNKLSNKEALSILKEYKSSDNINHLEIDEKVKRFMEWKNG